MEDTEGGLSFDFEGNLDAAPNIPTASNPVIQPDPNAAPSSGPAAPSPPADPASGQGNRRSFRQTVCRHWLRSLCMKGDSCGFLHQYDKSRMPVCRFFRLYGECREQDCVYKHTNEDIKECNMYKLGFCPNGPDCRYRHAKQPGPPPPVDEVLQKIQQLTSYSYGASNRFFQQRNTNYSQQADRSQFPQGANSTNQGAVPKPTATESSNMQQQLQQLPLAGQDQLQNLPSNPSNQTGRIATPLPQGLTRYFIVKSCNRENLELSVQQGVWATQRSNEAKLNEAFDSVEHVILVFSVNRTRHFQGCAKMTSKIGETAGGGNWKHAHGTAHYGRNFSVKWLKLCELTFNKTRHLRNPYNENLPVKISRDCQELEPSVGEQLASLLYLEPDSELMVAGKHPR
ncbi:30-kDa cleavage and polyadenylation specificity factor 30 isoform X3 [Beta vulgaris subsp. vulgaris]|uniref:30-kDa cleavage and polyadenylation specificity factor 30 isoform X3 n=1 Tax=Beta vulgaris subsp. vulgaris TaxID=3555 RepID=UPI0020366FC8|nr:30-kDa cleavage and polyadenylation specificity factor 30 isoform X3 [Beta vulgaris subsp. vulgaris]